jgi:hypothetical protein
MSSKDGAVRRQGQGPGTESDVDLSALLASLRAARDGDFSARLTAEGEGEWAEVAEASTPCWSATLGCRVSSSGCGGSSDARDV